jgi:hypothetical protein
VRYTELRARARDRLRRRYTGELDEPQAAGEDVPLPHKVTELAAS